MELALRVDNKEIAVPKLYCTRRLSSPTTIGPDRTLPDVRSRRTTRKRGPRARKAGHQPTGVAPATGLPGAEGAPLGAHESTTKGRLSPADSDRLPPRDHAGSQSDGAAARRIGAGDGRREDRECGRQARGPLPHEAIPGRNLPLSEPLAATPTRRPRRIDSDRRLAPDQSSASSQRPPARLAAGNDDSQGCRTQEARVQPTAAAPQGHPGAEGTLLDSTLIPTTITPWVRLR